MSILIKLICSCYCYWNHIKLLTIKFNFIYILTFFYFNLLQSFTDSLYLHNIWITSFFLHLTAEAFSIFLFIIKKHSNNLHTCCIAVIKKTLKLLSLLKVILLTKILKTFQKINNIFFSNRGESCMPVNGIDRQTMKNTELQKVNRLPELIINLKEVILSINLTMCNTESLTTETRKSINICKNEIESEKKSDCYFINLYHLLLPLTISFLLKGNPVTSVAVDSLLCQLWFRYKFVKALLKFTDDFFRIYECFH